MDHPNQSRIIRLSIHHTIEIETPCGERRTYQRAVKARELAPGAVIDENSLANWEIISFESRGSQ